MLCGAVGFTPEEAADHLNIAANTVKVNIRKVKEKTNWHKISELSASAVCEYLGFDYLKVRNEILESVVTGLIVIFFSLLLSPVEEMRQSRRNIARICTRVEYRHRTESIV
jgi:hypothetical protein